MDSSLKKITVGMISLGCPKTLVDSEIILGKLDRSQYSLMLTQGECDIALLNTCSFIQDAKEESIDHIMRLINLKKEGKIKRIVVMGCMVQQFPKQLAAELAEVDAFVGSGDYAKMPEIIREVSSGMKVTSIGEPGYLSSASDERVSLTPNHYRYLKISEGCDHICSFCTIPTYRGKHRSRSIEDVIQEANILTRRGAKEILLTGQDTTYFGRDYGGEFLLPELLQQLDQVENIGWIRLLYAYPSCLPKKLMEVMRDSKNICHYLDMPLQHGSDHMLQTMRRGITKRRTIDLVHQFRDHVEDLVIRTTFIVGFPGETERDFEELLEFLELMKFNRAGFFKYSQEDGSHAAGLPNQVSNDLKESRWHKAMQLQMKISKQNNAKMIGKQLKVLIEAEDDNQSHRWIGRSYMDAPEIDGAVFVDSKQPLKIGEFAETTVTEALDYDLVAQAQ